MKKDSYSRFVIAPPVVRFIFFNIKMFFLFFPHYSSCFFSKASLRLLETKTGVNYAALVAIVYNIKQLHAYSIGFTCLGCFLASAYMVVLATNHSNVGFSP